MSRRQTIQVTLRTASSPTPDVTIKSLTVDLRVTYPSDANLAEIEDTIHHAARQAVRELHHRAAIPVTGAENETETKREQR